MLSGYRSPQKPKLFGGCVDIFCTGLGLVAFAVLMLMVIGTLPSPEFHFALIAGK